MKRTFLISVAACWILLASCATVAARQNDAAQPDSSLSYFDAILANCAASRQGDVLVRERASFDSSRVDADGVVTGQLVKKELLKRLVFDYDDGKFAWFMMAVETGTDFAINQPNGVPKQIVEVGLEGWVCDSRDGTVARYHSGKKPVLWRRSRFPADDIAFLQMIELPDLRAFWAYERLVSHGKLESNSSLVSARSGKRFHSATSTGDSVRIQLKSEGIELPPEFTGLFQEFRFDANRLVPTEIRNVIQKKDGSSEVLSSCKYQWLEIDGVFVPRSMNSHANRQYRSGEDLHVGIEYRDFDFHWFSLNRKMDDSLFSPDRLEGDDAIRNMVDPELNNAETLLTKKAEVK